MEIPFSALGIHPRERSIFAKRNKAARLGERRDTPWRFGTVPVCFGFGRRAGAEALDDAGQMFEDVIDVGVGVVAAEAETDRAFGERAFHIHGS